MQWVVIAAFFDVDNSAALRREAGRSDQPKKQS